MQINFDIYEKTLKKFKEIKTFFFVYALISICIIAGAIFSGNLILSFLLSVLFIAVAIGFIFSFRKKLTRAIAETAAQIVMQEFKPEANSDKWTSEQKEINIETNQKTYYKKDLSVIDSYYGNLFAGTSFFYNIEVYFADILFGRKNNINFSLYGRIPNLDDGRTDGALPKYYAVRAETELTKDNIIIISPLKYFSPNNPKNLPKADINTGTEYNVYAQNPNEIPEQIKEKLVPAVIDYAKKLRTWVVTIITPEDIYFVSPQDDTLEPIIFASAQKQIFDKVSEYKELLEIIEAVSLLNKKD